MITTTIFRPLFRYVLSLFLFMTFGSFLPNCTFEVRDDDLLLVVDQLKYTYNLRGPDDKYWLPYSLEEVSGLTYLDKNRLLCVEDERGKVYTYNLETSQVEKKVKFSKDGDYEGIELVNGMLYVLESDGDIYSYDYPDGYEATEKKETGLKLKNDTEGFGYDPKSNALLIACKGDEDTSETKAKGKAVYAYHLKNASLDPEPFAEITLSNLATFVERHKKVKPKEKHLFFKPSAIAYNPVDHNYYVLASVGKLLIVLNHRGKIQGLYPLDPKLMKQPEGICFAPDGTMYISSERGSGDKGYILEYSIQRR